MKAADRKVNVQFVNMAAKDRSALKRFISESLINKSADVDKKWNPAKPDEQRHDVRIGIEKIQVSVTQEQEKATFNCGIVNLSLGGICLKIPKNQPVQVKEEIQISLDFLKAPFTVRGVVLEVVES